jgi:hypothetical protein
MGNGGFFISCFSFFNAGISPPISFRHAAS